MKSSSYKGSKSKVNKAVESNETVLLFHYAYSVSQALSHENVIVSK